MLDVAEVGMAATGLDHPEGLAFDAEGHLYAGGELGQIYRVREDGSAEELCRTGGFSLGMCFGPDDHLYVCNHGLQCVLKVKKTGEWSVFAEYAGTYKLRVPNSVVCDRNGHLYVSDSGGWKQGDGAVFRFDPDGNGSRFGDASFRFANGLALSPDERSLYVAESNADCVQAIDIRDGKAGAMTCAASGLYHVPDGVCTDREGRLYVTCFASNRIYRVRPGGTAELLLWDEDAMLLQAPTNCTVRCEPGMTLYYSNLNGSFIGKIKLED